MHTLPLCRDLKPGRDSAVEVAQSAGAMSLLPALRF